MWLRVLSWAGLIFCAIALVLGAGVATVLVVYPSHGSVVFAVFAEAFLLVLPASGALALLYRAPLFTRTEFADRSRRRLMICVAALSVAVVANTYVACTPFDMTPNAKFAARTYRPPGRVREVALPVTQPSQHARALLPNGPVAMIREPGQPLRDLIRVLNFQTDQR
jgi:hypothetical protein